MSVKLKKQLYSRGKQGTLVYSPDIAVFVKLADDQILDLSPYITEFSLGRVVNDVSSFSCSIDNRFGQFDRVIKRMDRITVYLKRISWLQVFSGYVTTIPWQTVVPGNVTITAQCTLKRLAHNYFDQNSFEGLKFFSYFNQDTDANLEDGGAARTVVRLLTNIVNWPLTNIHIQKIPPLWAEDAARVIQALVREGDGDSNFQNELSQIKKGLEAIIDAFGWRGYFDNDVKSMMNSWSNNADGKTGEAYTEAKWHELVGSAEGSDKYNIGSGGNVPETYLFDLKSNGLSVFGNRTPGKNNAYLIKLRLDAAESLAHLVADWVINARKLEYGEDRTSVNVPIISAYLDIDEQYDMINAEGGGCLNVKAEDNTSPAVRFVGTFNGFDLAKDYEVVSAFDKLLATTGDVRYSPPDYESSLERMKDSEANKYGLHKQTNSVIGTVYLQGTVVATWIGYPDYKFMVKQNGTEVDLADTTTQVIGAHPIRCMNGKVGLSEFGWGRAIKISNYKADPSKPGFYEYIKPKLKDYGWADYSRTEGENVWVFEGNDKYPMYWDNAGRIEAGLPLVEEQDAETYTGAWQNGTGQYPGQMTASGTKALFNVLFMGNNGVDEVSAILTGERSWINDTSVMNVIKEVNAASMRDFQSAPNGDFIAFIPDRIGRYDNFPAVQIRDIEILDFKAIASDNNLVTHYLSTADVEVPGQTLNTIFSIFYTSAMMTVEQAPLMNFILGLPIDDVEKEYGPTILETFGMRPVIQENKFIRNRAFNFAYALHKFQEMWANQWQFVVNLTFMPEVYPGMRVELIDRTLPNGTPAPLAVYVESVTHSGSRTSGFNTSLVVSTPMIKVNGKWTQFRPEYGPVSMPDTGDDVMTQAQKDANVKKMQNIYERNPGAIL